MEELRLVGVHDDGEHLVLQDTSDHHFLLPLDSQLRAAIQQARRFSSRKTNQETQEFGPRDIQARFRSGATVEEIAEESGWEITRLKRYEWPILAERAHMAQQAQKVQVIATTPRKNGYRSVFDGEPQTLLQTVTTHCPALGIAESSLDWDAWQRADHQWQICVRFRIDTPSAAPRELVDQQPLGLWIFNPTTLTITDDNDWARSLTTSPEEKTLTGSDSLFGDPRNITADETPTAEIPVINTVPAALPDKKPVTEQTDELLEVLNARRGQRIGQDTESDDHLAEILGRNMGHLSRRPRPISAPQDTTLFEHPVHPARAAAPETSPTQSPEQNSPSQKASIHPLGREDDHAQPTSAIVEITDDSAPRPLEQPKNESSPAAAEQQRPRPRGKTTSKRARSSVPSWDEIVFGAKNEDS